MNNIPENENLPIEEDFAEQENSTLFSAPTSGDNQKKKNISRKKRLPVAIISLLLVAALIGGTVAVIKLIPEKDDENVTSEPLVKEIEVLNNSSDDLKTVSITNSNGSFNLFSETEETTSTDSESESETETTKTVTWFMEGYEEGILSSYSLSSIADSVAAVSASREITTKTEAECGLDKPIIKADVVANDNKAYSVLIGNASPDKSGYYLKVSDKEKIYLVSNDIKDSLDFTAVSLANTDIIPAFDADKVSSDYKTDDGAIYVSDKLTISGKNFSEPVVLEKSSDATITYAVYKVTSPTIRVAANFDDLLNAFISGISVTGAYTLDVKSDSIKAVGLDNPDFIATMETEGISLTYKFKLQSDGNYAAIYDGAKLIKKVSKDAIPFIDTKTSDYYSDWVCLNSIDDLNGFTFKVGDASHHFSITANTDEETKEDNKYIVNYNNDKTIESQPFQDFYRECISITCSDFTMDNTSGEKAYTIIFEFSAGGSQTVEFVKFSETKYSYFIDGKPMGKVTIASLKSLEDELNKLLEK